MNPIMTTFAVRSHVAAYEVFSTTANMQTAPAEKLATEACDPAPAAPAQFEVGKVYATRSICDYDCIFRWKVIKRTEKSIWLQSGHWNGDEWVGRGDITRRALSKNWGGEAELVYPSGRYSMCPVLTAEKGDI